PTGPVESHEHASELLFTPGGQERRPLHRPDASADADGPEIAAQRLAHRVQGRIRMKVARVEAVGVAGLGQKLPGLAGIVGRWIDGERELEGPRDDRPRQTRGAE